MSKKYYWIKLKTDFFNLDEIDFLLSQKNGCEYVVLYQMLCLKTANNDGVLNTKIGEMIVPFDVNKIARDTKYFDVDTVIVAVELFKKLGLIYEEVDGTLKIASVSNMVGSETAWAEKKRLYRENKKLLAEGQSEDNVREEIDIRDKSIDIRDKDIRDKSKEKEKNSCPPKAGDDAVKAEIVEDYEVKFNTFYSAYPKKVSKQQVQKWFKKNKPNDKQFEHMMQRLEDFKKSKDWLKEKGQYIPYPSTWLNQKRWEDEITVSAKQTAEETAEEKYKNNIFMQILEEEKNGQRNDY